MSAPPSPTITHETPIMVIDDDMPLCRMLANVLTMEGYSVAAIVFPHARAELMSLYVVRTLRQAEHPTIILADPMTFGIPGTESLSDYLRDEAQRQPHLLYLMTTYSPASAISAGAWYCPDGHIAMPIDMNALLTLIADGERILRERAATPPDPFTITC